jgi:hypothetical protein
VTRDLIALPGTVSAPYWIEMQLSATQVSILAGTDPVGVGTWYSLGSIDRGSLVRPRFAALFARNESAGWGDCSAQFDDFEFAHGLPENNVEIIETSIADVSTYHPEAIFRSFIRRNPDDAGTYDLAAAQRAADRTKEAHLLFLVGESGCFLCDDPESLCDRDVLGA